MTATDVTFKAEPNSHKTIKRQHGFAYLLDVLHHTQIQPTPLRWEET